MPLRSLTKLWPQSFPVQVSLVISILSLLGMLVFAWFTGQQQSRLVFDATLNTSEAMAQNIAVDAAKYLLRKDYSNLEILLRQYGNLPGMLRLKAFDAEGHLLSHVVRQGDTSKVVYKIERVELAKEWQSYYQLADGQIIFWQPIVPSTHLLGWINLEISLETSSVIQRRLLTNTLIFGLVAAAVGIMLMLGYFRRPLKAIREASHFAAQLDQKRGEQLPVIRVAREFSTLAESLNVASLRLLEQEQELLSSNERLETILTYAVDGILTLDGELRLLSFNPSAERLFGYGQDYVDHSADYRVDYRVDHKDDPSEHLINPMDQSFEPRDQNHKLLGRKAQELFNMPLEGILAKHNTAYETSKLLGLRWDGSSFPCELSSSKVDLDKETLYIVIVRDISERVRYETTLKEREVEARKLALIASLTDNAVIVTDPQSRIEWVNEGFSRITGYSLDETIGKKPASSYKGSDTDPNTVNYIRNMLHKRQGFRVEILNYHKSGRPYWIEFELQPIFDEQGELINFMAIESDITERKGKRNPASSSKRVCRRSQQGPRANSYQG
ncbi:MAG: PAS domain S-box protein [Deinococcales bacterium]